MNPETLDQWNARRAANNVEVGYLMWKLARIAFPAVLGFELLRGLISLVLPS